MKKNRKLLITFDYELFLGNRSGSVDECLIEPTNKVLQVIEQHDCKAIFFVDTTHLLTLKKHFHLAACKNDFNTVTQHIANIAARGHEVFPHLHPHWLDAEYLPSTNEWRLLKTDQYRFYNINQQHRDELFNESIALLNEVIKPLKPHYRVDAYRAGGWCIQPFDTFMPYFKKNHILYDFSVLGKFYLFSNAQYFDFSSAPDKPIYRFEDDVTIEQPEGPFTEFNISSLPISQSVQLLNKIFLKLYYKITNDHSFKRGEGQIAVKIDPSLKKPTLTGYDILNSNWERVAIELMSAIKQKTYFSYLNRNEYMHFISHPKMLTNHTISMFNRFLKYATTHFSVETDFRKMI
jgi:hypothetical protein